MSDAPRELFVAFAEGYEYVDYAEYEPLAVHPQYSGEYIRADLYEQLKAERDALKGTVEIMSKNLKPGVAYDGLRVHGQLNRADGLILPNSLTGG